ncbi:hypothetical protein [Nonomuraea bangladeshensis]|uniref:hypothetical protein n=1 Tax=Nonomuraea bangladeshensis TaxID=404385 RepID=UPI0031E341CF
MTMLLLALVLAALITGVILWRRPDARTKAKALTSDARTVAAGAWKAGRTQAATEFRQGYKATRDAYDRAQKALQGRGTKRARFTSGLLELLGVTVVTAGGTVYGAAKTLGAARRILIEAARGGHAAYKTIEVEAVVVGEVEETSPDAVPPPAVPADTNTQAKPHAVRENPDAEQAPQPEGTPDMSVAQEATGLTSYALAHEQIAAELNNLHAASHLLVTSMGDLLAQHSHLIGNASTLQDLINQAATIAAQIAKDASAAATS